MISKNIFFKNSFVIFLLLFFLYGCSALTVRRDESNSIKAYDYSYETVWNDLIDVISQKGDTITLKNKGKGIILTGYDSMSVSELKRIGKMPPLEISSSLAGAWLYARNKVDYSIKAVSAGQTEAKIVVYLQAYNASGKRWINIFSNGTKEKETFDKLQSLLAQKNN